DGHSSAVGPRGWKRISIGKIIAPIKSRPRLVFFLLKEQFSLQARIVYVSVRKKTQNVTKRLETRHIRACAAMCAMVVAVKRADAFGDVERISIDRDAIARMQTPLLIAT